MPAVQLSDPFHLGDSFPAWVQQIANTLPLRESTSACAHVPRRTGACFRLPRLSLVRSNALRRVVLAPRLVRGPTWALL